MRLDSALLSPIPRSPWPAPRFAPSAVTLAILLALGTATTGCGDDDGPAPTDAGVAPMDAAGDGGAATTIDQLNVTERKTLGCAVESVDVVRDERGMVHIYARDLHDAACAMGYMMARDRLAQMEFIRRFATGRLAELASSFSPSLVDLDTDARFVGNARNGAAIYDTLPADEKDTLQAYSDGVNAYRDELLSGAIAFPRGIMEVLAPESVTDWTPADTLAIARYEAALLGYDGSGDAEMTAAMMAVNDAFPSTSTDPRLAARANVFHDFFPYRPARDVFVRDGFPNVTTDTGSRALRRPRGPATSPTPYVAPSRTAAEGAARFLSRLEREYFQPFGDETRGSNNWVVSGSKTMSGRAILSNDPHLQLTSPPLFWSVHIDTKKRGGDINAQGMALAGTPAILLGYNEDIAWGLTTTGFDATDCYRETITPGVGGAPDTVLFNGAQVPIEQVTEVIRLDTGATRTVTFERVPHHGYIIPGSRTPTEGISIKWTGNTPSDEAGAFLGLMRAHNVDEARTAFHGFEVGHQNLVVATRDGDIYWTTHLNVPVRDARAMTYDPMTHTGFAPSFVLPGTGEYEWTGRLDDRYIPHDLNPAKGFIATANGDAVGVTQDGNPFDDDHYIGWNFNSGHRIARITERLTELTTRGNVTVDELQALQADVKSPLGALLTTALVESLDRAEAERATPGTHADIAAAIAAAGPEKMAKIRMLRDRLAAWTSYDTPAAVEGTPNATEIADSVATTIFNTAFTRLIPLAFGDEYALIDDHRGVPDRTIVWALTAPETLRTYDATLGDTVLWDDLATATVSETRDDRVLRAFTAALDYLEMRLGAAMDEWRWGKMHTLTLGTTVPQLGTDILSIPPDHDPMFPNGFPRHGDWQTVDPAGFSLYDTTDFSYGSGPVQRLVVEMGTDGPHAFNAMPGGEIYDPDSPHHADEMEHWRRNEAPAMYFTEADVVGHAEAHIVLGPMP